MHGITRLPSLGSRILWGFLTAGSLAASPAGSDLWMDGVFDDWQAVPVASADPAGDAFTRDFAELRITNDERYLYLSLRFHSPEFLLQDGNDIHLYIDSDQRTETGLPVGGLGAELDWCFGRRTGRISLNGQTRPITHPDIGLVTLPSVTSRQFEIALALDNPAFTLQGTQTADTIRILLMETRDGGDFLPDAAGGLTYKIASQQSRPPEPLPLDRQAPDHLRLLTYNTLQSGFLDPARRPAFRRILTALDADIMGFQELYDSDLDLQDIFADWFPQQPWYVAQEGRSVGMVSRYPVLHRAVLTDSRRTLAVLVDLPDNLGDRLLVIVSHLACCDDDQSRQRDADQIMATLRAWKQGNGPFPLPESTPIIHVGDFNLVGEARQLATLTAGDILNEAVYGPDAPPDWDGSGFADLISRQPGTRMGYTWRDEGSLFSPGKLDYVLYSDHVIRPGNHFILQTLALSDSTLERHHLKSTDTPVASDHLPRVFDIAEIRVPKHSETGTAAPKEQLAPGYPNPFALETTLSYRLKRPSKVSLAIYDVTGRRVRTLVRNRQPAGSWSIRWDGTDARNHRVSAGVYFCRLQVGTRQTWQKLLYIR